MPDVNLEVELRAWARVGEGKGLDYFYSLPREIMDNFFLELSPAEQASLIQAMAIGERRVWIRLLAPEGAADLAQEYDVQVRPELLAELDDNTLNEVKGLLAYREDVDAGLINSCFARVRQEMTVDEAIAYLRRQARDVVTPYYVYVLNAKQLLLGVVSFRDLFVADRSKHVEDVMRTPCLAVQQDTDKAEVARLIRTHHLLALPVIDSDQRIQGVVTLDDLFSAAQNQASEEIQKFGGSEVLTGPYLEVSFGEMVRKRGGWLAILFVGEMLTATAMGFFEGELAKAVVLALFLPLIISSGGNSGSQATTLVIRAMALGEVRLRDWLRVIRREIAAGLVLGSALAIIGTIRILVWQAVTHQYGTHFIKIALTIACSLVGVVTFGTIAGSMLPFILRRFGLDPASASAPFVATLVDVTGLLIYFSLAALILKGTLL